MGITGPRSPVQLLVTPIPPPLIKFMDPAEALPFNPFPGGFCTVNLVFVSLNFVRRVLLDVTSSKTFLLFPPTPTPPPPPIQFLLEL